MKNIAAMMRFGAAASLMGLCGCGASTDLTSQANPEYAGHTYRKIMVEADISDLRFRHKIEEEFCGRIQDKTTSTCVQSTVVFFPGQSYTLDEMKARVTAQQVDAILFIQGNSGTTSTYVPPTIYTTANVTANGNAAYGQSTTQVIGGGNITKPWANYQASLWQTQDQKVAWYASGQSRGNAFASWDDLIESAAEETIDHMKDDGILQESP